MERRAINILLVEDSEEDIDFTRKALQKGKIHNELNVVKDGVEALKYLRALDKYEGRSLPDIILLDLNLPKKDGREVLGEVKMDDTLKQIPVIVLTTSKAEEDILRTYDMGVNSFVTKPVTFEGLVDMVRVLTSYWIQIVELPPADALATA